MLASARLAVLQLNRIYNPNASAKFFNRYVQTTSESNSSEMQKKKRIKNEVWFPNISIAVMSPTKDKGKLKEMTFRMRPNMGKKDLEAILTQIYNMKVTKINTLTYEPKLKHSKHGGFYKKGVTYKKAYVTYIPEEKKE
jgi:ribosomal protein L23